MLLLVSIRINIRCAISGKIRNSKLLEPLYAISALIEANRMVLYKMLLDEPKECCNKPLVITKTNSISSIAIKKHCENSIISNPISVILSKMQYQSRLYICDLEVILFR